MPLPKSAPIAARATEVYCEVWSIILRRMSSNNSSSSSSNNKNTSPAARAASSDLDDLSELLPYLRQLLTCCACAGLLDDAMISLACGHCYCYECQFREPLLKIPCRQCRERTGLVIESQLQLLVKCYKSMCCVLGEELRRNSVVLSPKVVTAAANKPEPAEGASLPGGPDSDVKREADDGTDEGKENKMAETAPLPLAEDRPESSVPLKSTGNSNNTKATDPNFDPVAEIVREVEKGVKVSREIFVIKAPIKYRNIKTVVAPKKEPAASTTAATTTSSFASLPGKEPADEPQKAAEKVSSSTVGKVKRVRKLGRLGRLGKTGKKVVPKKSLRLTKLAGKLKAPRSRKRVLQEEEEEEEEEKEKGSEKVKKEEEERSEEEIKPKKKKKKKTLPPPLPAPSPSSSSPSSSDKPEGSQKPTQCKIKRKKVIGTNKKEGKEATATPTKRKARKGGNQPTAATQQTTLDVAKTETKPPVKERAKWLSPERPLPLYRAGLFDCHELRLDVLPVGAQCFDGDCLDVTEKAVTVRESERPASVLAGALERLSGPDWKGAAAKRKAGERREAMRVRRWGAMCPSVVVRRPRDAILKMVLMQCKAAKSRRKMRYRAVQQQQQQQQQQQLQQFQHRYHHYHYRQQVMKKSSSPLFPPPHPALPPPPPPPPPLHPPQSPLPPHTLQAPPPSSPFHPRRHHHHHHLPSPHHHHHPHPHHPHHPHPPPPPPTHPPPPPPPPPPLPLPAGDIPLPDDIPIIAGDANQEDFDWKKFSEYLESDDDLLPSSDMSTPGGQQGGGGGGGGGGGQLQQQQHPTTTTTMGVPPPPPPPPPPHGPQAPPLPPPPHPSHDPRLGPVHFEKFGYPHPPPPPPRHMMRPPFLGPPLSGTHHMPHGPQIPPHTGGPHPSMMPFGPPMRSPRDGFFHHRLMGPDDFLPGRGGGVMRPPPDAGPFPGPMTPGGAAEGFSPGGVCPDSPYGQHSPRPPPTTPGGHPPHQQGGGHFPPMPSPRMRFPPPPNGGHFPPEALLMPAKANPKKRSSGSMTGMVGRLKLESPRTPPQKQKKTTATSVPSSPVPISQAQTTPQQQQQQGQGAGQGAGQTSGKKRRSPGYSEAGWRCRCGTNNVMFPDKVCAKGKCPCYTKGIACKNCLCRHCHNPFGVREVTATSASSPAADLTLPSVAADTEPVAADTEPVGADSEHVPADTPQPVTADAEPVPADVVSDSAANSAPDSA